MVKQGKLPMRSAYVGKGKQCACYSNAVGFREVYAGILHTSREVADTLPMPRRCRADAVLMPTCQKCNSAPDCSPSICSRDPKHNLRDPVRDEPQSVYHTWSSTLCAKLNPWRLSSGKLQDFERWILGPWVLLSKYTVMSRVEGYYSSKASIQVTYDNRNFWEVR